MIGLWYLISHWSAKFAKSAEVGCFPPNPARLTALYPSTSTRLSRTSSHSISLDTSHNELNWTGREYHSYTLSTVLADMARLRSAKAAPSPAPTNTTEATRRPILREKTNTMAAATPGPGAEKSMLALKNFKRRPRQSSVLELVKHRRSSAAANRSLAASVIQQHRQEEEGGVDHENTSVFDLGSASEDDEEVFAPEAEGTPVLLDKKKMRVSGSARKTVEARSDANASAVKGNKRKSGDLEDSSHSALDALRKKHRKSEPSHVENEEEEHLPEVDHSTHSAGHVLPDHQSSPVPDRTASEVQVINSSPQHSSPLTSPASSRGFPGPAEADLTVPSTEEQERARTNLDDPEDEDEDEADSPDVANATMAEPASSSPITSPILETQRTDIYADPLTQASPSPAREPARTRSQNTTDNKKNQPASLSTAKLRALLPRRTQKPQPRPRRTEYDISSDSDDEDDDGTALGTTNSGNDEDEDAFRNSRSRRQTKTATHAKSSKKKPTTATAASNSTRAKSKPATQPNRSKSKSKATTRQYGRAAAAAASASDKENAGGEQQDDEEGEGEDTTLTMKDLAHSRELEEARRKFAEVDEWDLAFESMSNEDHRSSSQNWR